MMRKVISLLLSFAMLITMVTTMAISTNAAAETVSKLVLDFEDQTGVGKHVGDTGSGYYDNSTLSSTFDYWKASAGAYSARVNGKNNLVSFVLPENWWVYYDSSRDFTFTKPNAISFEVTNTSTQKSAQVNFGGFDDKDNSISSPAQANCTALSIVGSNTANSKTKATITYKIPTTLDLSQFTRFVISVWGTNDNCLVDNITLTYPTAFTATFSGTETATLASAVEDETLDFVAGDEYVTLPSATLDGGKTFAGWVTEKAPETILTAGTQVALEDDEEYYAVATDRAAKATPAAPTVSSLEATTVTLTATDNYQYSIDGTNWQDSNVFTGLTPATEYTFYQKSVTSPAYLESASSEGTTVTTPAIFTFEAESVKTSTYTGTIDTNVIGDKGISNQTYVRHDASSPAVGQYFSLDLTGLIPGVYEVAFPSRCTNTRSAYNVTAYDSTEVEQDLGTVDFGALQNKVSGTDYYYRPTTENTVNVTEGSTLKLTLTISTARTMGTYLDKVVLTKIADYTPPVVDPYADIAGTTSATAQLRIGNLNGIRFITNVNANKVAAAETAGYTVTFGTLIAPVDLVEGELSFDSSDYIDVVSGGYFKYNSGVVAGSIVGIKTDNVARDFIARGYVKLTKDETTTVYYATQPNEGRSLKTVAAACVEDISFFNMLNDAQKEQVTTWATWANA